MIKTTLASRIIRTLVAAMLLGNCTACQSLLPTFENTSSPNAVTTAGTLVRGEIATLAGPPQIETSAVATPPRIVTHHERRIDTAVELPVADMPAAHFAPVTTIASEVRQASALHANTLDDNMRGGSGLAETPVTQASHAVAWMASESQRLAPVAAKRIAPVTEVAEATTATRWMQEPVTPEANAASQANVEVPIVADGYFDPNEVPTEGCVMTGDSPSSCIDPVDAGWAEGCQMLPGDTPLHLADEYLCDGGDRAVRARVSRDWQVSGLDLEDTIGHFDTLDGRVIVTPSNSVCIYAPRFAAIRKVVQTSEDGLALAMHEVDNPAPTTIATNVNEAIKVHQPLAPGRDTGLHAARGLLHRVRGLESLHALPLAELAKDFETYEDLQVIRTGIHSSSQRALLEQWSQAATIWDDTVAPEVIIDGAPAAVDTTIEKSATIHHLGLPGKPKLRVIKLASTNAALPGEEVTFTLRFDNVGDQTIGNVTIMDNLTTRLEYVPDSAQCNLDGKFYSDPNQGESLALRWEITEPLKPGDGGIIRFRCKVR